MTACHQTEKKIVMEGSIAKLLGLGEVTSGGASPMRELEQAADIMKRWEGSGNGT